MALIFVPIANGHFDFDPARSAGGKLFALSKAPKKGVRPIVVTDAVRALVCKTLYSQEEVQKSLADYSTNIHPRVMQMGIGLKSGATIMQHLICTLLGAHPDCYATPCNDKDKIAAVTIDVKNAFNEVSRATLFVFGVTVTMTFRSASLSCALLGALVFSTYDFVCCLFVHVCVHACLVFCGMPFCAVFSCSLGTLLSTVSGHSFYCF